MNILITGGDGQLGWQLNRSIPDGLNIYSFNKSELDITDKQSVQEKVSNIKPDYIINTAAYTAVDRAEEESQLAFEINSSGACNLAAAAVENDAKIIHISTDFIFDGKTSRPYKPDDNANPLSVYGKSKYDGEKKINDICNGKEIIIRSSWIYSTHGKNFVKTMLSLMKERSELKVVCDQIGTPTWINGLAEFIWFMVNKKKLNGIYHWTDAGVASWYDFAVAIQEEAMLLGIINKPLTIVPISTDSYPTPATRPKYSVLDKSATWDVYDKKIMHWRTCLREMLMLYKKTIK